MRKTKIVATIGPTSNTFEQICELGDKGVNVCRMNMSHGDHASHQEVIDKIKQYNELGRGCMAILLDTKVRAVCVHPTGTARAVASAKVYYTCTPPYMRMARCGMVACFAAAAAHTSRL